MPDNDALLARLNALKKSSVSLDTTPTASLTTTPSKATTAPDDLAARFARLGSASPSASPKPASGAPVIAPGAPSYLEGVAEGLGGGDADVEFNEEDEKSLEELLGELGGREQWDVRGEDQQDLGKLMREAKKVLPEVQKTLAERRDVESRGSEGAQGRTKDGMTEDLTDWENIEVDIGSAGVKVGQEDQNEAAEEENSEEGEDKKRTEDQDADDIIARVMAELAIDKKYGNPEDPATNEDKESTSEENKQDEQRPQAQQSSTDTPRSNDGLNLPSAPTSLPPDDLAETQAIEDALTARLVALSKPASDSLGLPSAPSFAPSNKPPKVTGSLPKYTDEEIDTWCIICMDDATLKCLGCDGDLYCQKCWMEGHRGEGAGYEERRHKAALFKKGGEKKKVAAAG